MREICRVDKSYLENTVRVPLVHLEAFDSYGQSLILSAAHFRETPVVTDLPNTYVLLLEGIR